VFAEAELRAANNPSEVTLAEIAERILELRGLPGAEGLDAAVIVEAEMAAERLVCYANPEARLALALLRAARVRHGFLSDTYHPAPFLRELLEQTLDVGADTPVIASSEHRETKHSGRLYRVVAASAEARRPCGKPRRRVHIGDNRTADVASARREGVRPIQYLRPAIARKISSRWRPPQSGFDFASPLAPDGPVLEAIGSICLAPLLAGFCAWLRLEIERLSPSRVLYLARDGAIMKWAMDHLAPEHAGRGVFAWASRRALLLPAVTDLTEEAAAYLIRHSANRSMGDILEGLRLPRDCVENPDLIVRTDADKAAMRQTLMRMAPELTDRAREERATLLAYLASLGVERGKRVLLVDIGWRGSMQWALQTLLPEVELHGRYLALNPDAGRAVAPDRAAGWLSDFGQSPLSQHLRHCVAILELMFSQAEGTILRVEREGDGFRAVRAEDTEADGLRAQAIEAMQGAAKSRIRELAEIGLDNTPREWLEPERVAPALLALSRYPSLRSATSFGKLPHAIDLGDARPTRLDGLPGSMAEAVSLRKALKSARSAQWRRGTLSTLSLGLASKLLR
jgi:FMN phosphatase YigB (HAD superfamily)